MVVIWQKEATEDLKDYTQKSRMYTENKVKHYVVSLSEYAELLENNPKMGKVIYKYKNIEIRQLLYKMHRIIYYIKGNKIIIAKVVHTARNVDRVIEYLTKYFD